MGNKIAKFKGREPEEKQPKQQTCQAAGCPLFGTRASSPGSDKWWCRFHYGQELSTFSRITDRIERSRPMIDHINRLKRSGADKIQKREPWLFNYGNNPEFSIREDESYGAYVTRLEAALKRAIMQGITHEKLEDTKEMVGGFAQTVRTNERTWDEKTNTESLLEAERARLGNANE